MSVFRVEKNKGYTVMSNHHLRSHTLSLKARELLRKSYIPNKSEHQRRKRMTI